MRSQRGTSVVLCGVLWCSLLLGCGSGKTGAAAAADRAVSTTSVSDSAATPRPAPSGAAASAPARVLFLGTSLTAGLGLDPDSAYPQRIQRKITDAGLRYEVVNAGVSGETSAGLLQRLDWVLQQPAKVIVVETGANDGLRGLPVEATRATIGRVLDRIKRDRPEAAVLLVQMEAPTNLGAAYTRAFHGMFPSLAAETGVTLLPFLLQGVAGDPRLNQADGVHPNDAGERIVTENVWRGLAPVLRQLPFAAGNR